MPCFAAGILPPAAHNVTRTRGGKINGTIDWDETFAALKEIGYKGVYNMELHLPRYGEEIMPETGAFAAGAGAELVPRIPSRTCFTISSMLSLL